MYLFLPLPEWGHRIERPVRKELNKETFHEVERIVHKNIDVSALSLDDDDFVIPLEEDDPDDDEEYEEYEDWYDAEDDDISK